MEGKQYTGISNLVITPEGIFKLLARLNVNKANGPDQVPTRILKEAPQEIAPLLTFVFNKSVQTGVVPGEWRKANIVAIYKGKGSKQEAASYRPVSLTSVPCKILEHVIFRHVMHHCEENNILVDYQHGFRSKRSCETQLVTTLDDICRSGDRGNNINLLILDFSKAFDSVPHVRLMRKLEHYGITGDIGRLIKNWLSDRHQQVAMDGSLPEPVKVRSGVPREQCWPFTLPIVCE